MSRNSMVLEAWSGLDGQLRAAGDGVGLLGLRAVLGWEFWEAGIQKYQGSNWFGSVQESFPFPFNLIPVELSWLLATWFEIVGAIALWLGIATRFFAFALLFLTCVATAAVHWPEAWSSLGELWQGYAVSNKGFGNFKLPLLFAVMLLPLALSGAGALSLDQLLARRLGQHALVGAGLVGWSCACVVVGVPMLMLIPEAGAALLGAGAMLLLARRLYAPKNF
jgi:putative oxidoreductase